MDIQETIDTRANTGAAPLPMDALADFERLQELGRGGSGIVYKARQKTLDRDVAIKVIMRGRAASSEAMDQFLSEARIAAKLSHPNLVRVYDAGEQGGWPFYAMEYIEGESLRDVLERGAMGPKDAAAIMEQIARAVAYLHENNIVHCDLKPANILLDKDGTPYVTDFGLSRIQGRSALPFSQGTVAGTPGYMSPEQARGDVKDTSFLSDIYSMGAILYHVLAGRRAFNDARTSEFLDHVVGRAPAPLRTIDKSIPRGIAAICMKCMEKNPSARYASAKALAEDLARFRADEPLDAHGPGPVRVVMRWLLREPALASRVIAMGVLLAVELVWYHIFQITGPRFHLAVMTIVPIWGACSWLFRKLDRRRPQADAVRFCWASADVLFLTAVIMLSEAKILTPAVMCYPLLVAGSGLWHRATLVRVSTMLSMLSYGLIWYISWRLDPAGAGAYDHHIIFLIALGILGFMIGGLARQVEILSSRLRR